MERQEQSVWLTRMRWRMRGAWLWPTFIALTLAEGVALEVLPIAGDGPGGRAPGRAARRLREPDPGGRRRAAGGRRLRRRRPDLPRVVAQNYAGTALLVAMAAVFLGIGLIHRPAVSRGRTTCARRRPPSTTTCSRRRPSTVAGIALADPLRLEEDLYRTCVPGPDPKRWLCLFVNTDQRPAGITLDHDRAPNTDYRLHGGFE